jgi:hypothetical protein
VNQELEVWVPFDEQLCDGDPFRSDGLTDDPLLGKGTFFKEEFYDFHVAPFYNAEQ